MSGQVYINEHGHGIRPATLVREYVSDTPGQAGARIVVAFTDERGGQRDCFASSVYPDRAEAEKHP